MNRQVRVIERQGTVAELHAVDLFAELHPDGDVIDVVICRPDGAAVALGSRQQPDILDAAACQRAGLAISGRRSGGGLVVIEPSAVIWIDIVVPAGLGSYDVHASMVEIGEHWESALRPEFDGRTLAVHRGGMERTAWSDLVCFAGFGPGEVLLDHHKLVGLSQRRTRNGARFQGLVHTAPLRTDVTSLFAGEVPEAPIPSVAVAAGLTAGTVAARLAATLTGT